MSRMVDLIKASAVPAPLMQVAARGALSLPPAEMLEVLVFLTHNPVFCNQAKLTLAGWEENSARTVLSDPHAPADVLAYFIDPDNIRPALLPALLENQAIPEKALCRLAAANSREIVETLLQSKRVHQSAPVVSVLRNNPHIRPEDAECLGSPAESTGDAVAAPSAFHEHQDDERLVTGAVGDSEEILQVLTAFERQHAAEIAADANKPFQPLGGFVAELELDDTPADAAFEPDPAATVTATAPATGVGHAAAAGPARQKPKAKPTEHERISTLQKIAKLDVKGRIHLAVRGNKEERAILVRDGTKLVALAVLESPKISDMEVEGFASQKNVLEALLRAIPMKRRFAKNYSVVRNLVFNPRTPLDTSLGLMKNLLVNDLKNLAGNKEVSETIRKMALRGFRQKMTGKG
jgi:hypothetical protein